MNVIHYVGLDVHKDSIAVSIAPSDSTEVRRWGIIGGTHDHVLRLIKQLRAAHPQATLQFCSRGKFNPTRGGREPGKLLRKRTRPDEREPASFF